MRIFIFHDLKTVFLTPHKCGNTTIASILFGKPNPIHTYSDEEIIQALSNNEYCKYIILREDICGRFLSGIYEEMLYNDCYLSMNDITFETLIDSILNWGLTRVKRVTNIEHHKISSFGRPFTDPCGLYNNHLMSQYYSIGKYLKIMYGCNNKGMATKIPNAYVVELSQLSDLLNTLKLPALTCNSKKRTDCPISAEEYMKLPVSIIAQNKLYTSAEHIFSDEIQTRILDLYAIDLKLIDTLKMSKEIAFVGATCSSNY